MHEPGEHQSTPAGPPVIPLTRPILAISIGALAISGVSLFLAGMATGLGMTAPAGHTAPTPIMAAHAAEAVEMEVLPRRLVVGSLMPLETAPAVEEIEPPATRVAWTTTEGETVSGRVADEPPPGVELQASAVLVTPMTYAIQTGAFKVAANAERQSADLRRLGFQPRTTDHVGSRGVPLTVVYAGHYSTRADAEENARTLQKAGIQTYVTALAD